MNNFIKFSWDSGETRTLIDGQTAYGFTKPLSHEDFINKNLIPWIEPKPDILDKGAELLVQWEITEVIRMLFSGVSIDRDKLESDFNSSLLSSGSVHGNKEYS